jgi:hypothetical protein
MNARYLTLTAVVLAIGLAGCLPKPLPRLDVEHIEGKLTSELPGGWRVRGPAIGVQPERLGVFTDEKIARSGNSVSLLSVDAVNADWGSVMQDIDATSYRGKRIRFSGYIRANTVSGWAGLWMSVETETREDIAYDNMEDRSIRGTSDWQQYAVVLDIDSDAVIISIGIALHGQGQVWLDDCAFEVVDESVSPTGTFTSSRPRTRAIPDRLYDAPANLTMDEEFFE